MWKAILSLLPWIFCFSLQAWSKNINNEVIVGINDYDRSPGKPMGMMPFCPGFNKSASIADDYLYKYYSVVVQKGWSAKKGMYRKRYFYKKAADGIASDPNVDFKNRKTMIVLSESPLSSNLDAAFQISKLFSRIGYNAISVTTKPFTHARYAVTARLAKAVGNVTAILISDLIRRGLDPADIVMVGGSLGAHMAGFTGKYLYQMTGRKLGHIIAVDPTGLCFRYAEPQDRLAPTDADFVQAMHANMYGFGMEAPVGHADFYMNGGVFQSSWFAALPCLTICSHVKAFQYFYYVIKYPGKFRGARCTDVHQAINSNCFNNIPDVSNTIGLNIDKNMTGVFYVPAVHLKPYFVLDYKTDIIKDFLTRVNPNGTMIIDDNTVFGYDYSTDIPKGLQNGYDKLRAYDYTTEDPGVNPASNYLKNLDFSKLIQ